MEIDDPSDFTAEAIQEEISPTPLEKQTFSKPRFPRKK
jgi:hypothetical protein